MRTRNYNQMVQDFGNWADTMNRVLAGVTAPYDYAGNDDSHTTTEEAADQSKLQPALRLPMDIWQEGENFILNAYLPGVDPEQVEITWQGEELTVRGEMPAPTT
jgi:HSP20 family protein